jgi:hypothetical protein
MANDAWYDTVPCIEMVLFLSCNYLSSCYKPIDILEVRLIHHIAYILVLLCEELCSVLFTYLNLFSAE